MICGNLTQSILSSFLQFELRPAKHELRGIVLAGASLGKKRREKERGVGNSLRRRGVGG